MSGIGARSIGGAAASACRRRRTLVALGVDPAGLRTRLLGDESSDPVSPLAEVEGYRFQQGVLAKGAARLREAAKAAGLAPLDGATGDGDDDAFRCITIDAADTGDTTGRDPLADTQEWLHKDGAGIVLLAEAHLHLVVGKVTHTIRPDLLIGDLSTGLWRVGEIKSYLDRGGKTTPAGVAAACRQMAVAAVSLSRVLGEGRVATEGDLVLRARRSGGVSMHRMDLSGEIRIVERFLVEAAGLAHDGPLAPPASIDDVLRIPCQLDATCVTSCDMLPVCAASGEAGQRLALGTGAGVIDRLGGYDAAVRLCTSGTGPDDSDGRSLQLGFELAMRCVGSGNTP